jgi:UrcA family protein
MKQLCCAALVAFVAAMPAFAADQSAPKIRISHAELSSDAGALAVYARIQKASAQACNSGYRAPLWLREIANRCRAQVTADLVTQISDTRLTAVHATASAANPLAASE